MQNENLNSFLQSSWAFYFFSIAILFALYFIQKNLFLLDRKLAPETMSETNKRKPWPLFASMATGVFWYLHNTFSRNPLNFNFKPETKVKWIFMGLLLFCLLGMIYESFSFFGLKKGLIRILIHSLLIVLYFYAGLFTGLLIATVIAILLLFFVFKFFRKRLT